MVVVVNLAARARAPAVWLAAQAQSVEVRCCETVNKPRHDHWQPAVRSVTYRLPELRPACAHKYPLPPHAIPAICCLVAPVQTRWLLRPRAGVFPARLFGPGVPDSGGHWPREPECR